MPYSKALTLKVANKGDFSPLLVVLVLLSIVSAVLSSQPILLILVSFIAFAAGWFSFILHSSKINDIKLISIILPDGQVRINSIEGSKIEGYLGGIQWCTSHIAVLRYISEEGRLRYLVFLSGQQHSNNFRRLQVWLRHGYCNNTDNHQVSDVAG